MNLTDLRLQAQLVMQYRLKKILKEIVEDECINHSCSLEIEAIHKLWSMLNLEWIDESEEANRN